MSEQQPTEPEKLFGIGPESRPECAPDAYAPSSSVGDIVAGIVSAIIWWGIGIAAASGYQRNINAAAAVVILLFFAQVLIVGMKMRRPAAFLISELLAAVLLPILALGLVFGACLLASR